MCVCLCRREECLSVTVREECSWLTDRMISGFRSEVNENCILLGCYAASSGDSLPALEDNLSGPIFKGEESKNKAGGNRTTRFIQGVPGGMCQTSGECSLR